MSLVQIDLRTEFNHRYGKKFNIQSWCMSELYWSKLKGYETGRVRKCGIQVSDNWGEKEFEYTNWTDLKGINLTIDFDKYFACNKIDKKRMQLELIHTGMMMIAEREGWEIDPLLDAYNECLDENLEYKFFVSGKFKASPDRKQKVGLWCYWDLDICSLYWVLFSKYGVESEKKLIVSVVPSKGEFVYYLKWKWKWKDKYTVVIEDTYKYGLNQTWEFKVVVE